VQEKIDVMTVMHNSKPPQETMFDDASGSLEVSSHHYVTAASSHHRLIPYLALQIFRVEDYEKFPYPKELYGQFFSGECFLVVYKYSVNKNSVEKSLIYFWQGRDASIVSCYLLHIHSFVTKGLVIIIERERFFRISHEGN
jgi:hypothetical protein